jgi:hypothetical protein
MDAISEKTAIDKYFCEGFVTDKNKKNVPAIINREAKKRIQIGMGFFR